MKTSHRNDPSGFHTFTHLSFPVAGPKGLFLSSFPTLSPQSITQIISVKKFASKKKKKKRLVSGYARNMAYDTNNKATGNMVSFHDHVP